MKGYFKSLYARAMREAYTLAQNRIVAALKHGGSCLDCGAGAGHMYDNLVDRVSGLNPTRYTGIERDPRMVESGQTRGLNIINADVNERLPFPDGTFRCVFALSLLEHLLHGCRFLRECHRILQPDGVLVVLTPNISTYFTVALILSGRMPSTGPHPDSEALLRKEEPIEVSDIIEWRDVESDQPSHRHLVVFSYRALKSFLGMAGFNNIQGKGFGLYPFPNMMQPFLEKIDPYHCHQLVFDARK